MRKSPSAPAEPETQVIPYALCPAKTFQDADGNVRLGRDVFTHCQIVGEVARELLSRMPDWLRTQLYPEGSHLIAACHDIGKVSPTFYQKLYKACTTRPAERPALTGVDCGIETQWGGHAGVSQLTAHALDVGRFIPEILGQHHGFAPSDFAISAFSSNLGGQPWHNERQALVTALKQHLHSDWPTQLTPAQAKAIAGLTSVADWIGSGSFFEDPSGDWKTQISVALDAAGFTPPRLLHGLSFKELFKYDINEMQQRLADEVLAPGVYTLEAPMGLGKTEAALYAAYRMLEKGAATGIYFALPTQLTSNKIHDRFNAFLDKILAEDCRHRRSLLLHSTAWLLEDCEMGEEGRPGGAWFNTAKRGLLAPFAVGTQDQALMAAMRVKHGFVRAFGLAGKVVILDEVHSYDAYTGTILDKLVALLRELHCTAIILSATLTQSRRQQLMSCAVTKRDYPLISSLIQGEIPNEEPVTPPPDNTIHLRMTESVSNAIEECLSRAEKGEHVLWIENSIAEAQERYKDFAARCKDLNIPCGLLHSRFTAQHRQQNEGLWVAVYGKTGHTQRQNTGRILVGSPVLEQSLDVDGDFLVSRFAPTDMIFQRLGRLWRHKETPRPSCAKRQAWIIAPELESAIENPEKAFGVSAKIYDPYILCRSLEVWSGLHHVTLPTEIRHMLEKTYEERPEIGQLARLKTELYEGRLKKTGENTKRQLARLTLATNSHTLPEHKAKTRYSEDDSIEVLILKHLHYSTENKETVLTLLDGSVVILPNQRHRLSRQEWRRLSITLSGQIVKVRESSAPTANSIDELKKLGFQHVFYLGSPEHDEATLRVLLREDDGNLVGINHTKPHKSHHYSYRDDIGFKRQSASAS